MSPQSSSAQLVDANSKLAVSYSAAEVAGPGLAGVLVQVVGAPATLIADAASFALSGGLIGRIRAKESEPKPRSRESSVLREMAEGTGYLVRDPILRTLAGAVACGNVFENARYAVLVLYMSRNLRLSPGEIGLVLATGSIGFFLGAFLPGRLSKRFGLGRTIVGSLMVLAFSEFLVPFASGPKRVAVPILIASIFIGGLAVAPFDVNQFSLRQAITPADLLGRVNGSARFLIRGAVPIGALIGGSIGELYGLRATLFFGAFGGLSSLLWIFRSPIPALRKPPHAPIPD